MDRRGTGRKAQEDPEQGAPGSLAPGRAQTLYRGRARRRAAKADDAIAGPDGGRAETVRLAGRPSLFDRRYRGDAVREADRRGDRARRNDREKTSPRHRLVD